MGKSRPHRNDTRGDWIGAADFSRYGKPIAENIHLRMAHSDFEDMSESEVVVSQGFTSLKLCAFTAEGEILPLHQAPDDKGKIAQ